VETVDSDTHDDNTFEDAREESASVLSARSDEASFADAVDDDEQPVDDDDDDDGCLVTQFALTASGEVSEC
jgi:hypothetical protein